VLRHYSHSTLCRPVIAYFFHTFYSSCYKFYSIVTTFFFFNHTATTEIYTLSLHDALPILRGTLRQYPFHQRRGRSRMARRGQRRSEEHTSELQSRFDLVCRLLLEKKKKKRHSTPESNRIEQKTTNYSSKSSIGYRSTPSNL